MVTKMMSHGASGGGGGAAGGDGGSDGAGGGALGGQMPWQTHHLLSYAFVCGAERQSQTPGLRAQQRQLGWWRVGGACGAAAQRRRGFGSRRHWKIARECPRGSALFQLLYSTKL